MEKVMVTLRRDTADDAPETASERRFAGMTPRAAGLKTAIRELRARRRRR